MLNISMLDHGIHHGRGSRGVAMVPVLARNAQNGFTMVEMIAVMVVAAVLAALAAQRFFDNNAFDSHGFHEQVASALRYAQKAAIAQKRYVCVSFPANNKVTLTINTSATCPGSSLASPFADAASTTYSVSATNSNVTLSGYADFYFDALGRPYSNGDTPPSSTFVKQTLNVSGYTAPIYIEAETGYVH